MFFKRNLLPQAVLGGGARAARYAWGDKKGKKSLLALIIRNLQNFSGAGFCQGGGWGQ